MVVVGEVPDVTPYLAVSSVCVVPVRFGSGTRLKVLEAFAHRVPVVSTALGVEGIDAVSGRHLLVSDDAEGFAAACAAILDDPDLRIRLADAAYDLWRQRYRWEDKVEAAASLVNTVSGRASAAGDTGGGALDP